MMKMRLICFGLLLNCLIYHTYAQTFICNSLEGYDTKVLTSAIQWQVTTDYQCLGRPAADCTFYISFCQPAPMCFNEYSACQNASEASNVTIIGAYTTHIFHENESGPRGFYANFSAGPMQNISNTTRCEPTLKIKFDCNLDAKWLTPLGNETGMAPEPTDIDVEDINPCATIMTFDYPGACFNGTEPTNSTTMSTTTTSAAPTRGISAGAIFLIILFSSALVYFIIGLSYNGFVKHQSGIHLLPQAQFWIGLPLHAIEGCRATLTCCSGSSKASRATYESV